MGIHSCSGPIGEEEVQVVLLGGSWRCLGSWEAPVPSQLMDVKMWSAPFETLSL